MSNRMNEGKNEEIAKKRKYKIKSNFSDLIFEGGLAACYWPTVADQHISGRASLFWANT